jgi:hypothetical protein
MKVKRFRMLRIILRITNYITHYELYYALRIILRITNYITHYELYYELRIILRITNYITNYITHYELYYALRIILRGCEVEWEKNDHVKNSQKLRRLRNISTFFGQNRMCNGGKVLDYIECNKPIRT